jgi:hypothetical protein
MNRYPGPGGGARAADSGLMVPRRCARRWCSGWCAARRHALSAGPGLRQRAGGCCTRGGTLILRMRMRGAAGARTLKRLLVTPGLAATARHGNVMPCPRVVASPARFMEAAPVCCYSTGSEAATSSKDANRRQAYRLMARSHARSDDGHTPKPDAIDMLVEQVAAEQLV